VWYSHRAEVGDVIAPLLAFYGHHKAGTRWLGRILEDIGAATGLHYHCVSNPKWFDFDLASYVSRHDIHLLAFTNADIRYVDQLGAHRAFHVIRDPRDIAVSAYFSHLATHGTEYWPELAAHRARLSALDFADGLLLDLEFTSRLTTDGYDLRPFEAMAEWDYARPGTVEATFEALVSDPVRQVTRLLADLRPFAPLDTITAAVGANTFEALSGGRRPGEEDRGNHYRRGTPGDWRHYFRQPHKNFFRTNYPDLIGKLGYRQDDW